MLLEVPACVDAQRVDGLVPCLHACPLLLNIVQKQRTKIDNVQKQRTKIDIVYFCMLLLVRPLYAVACKTFVRLQLRSTA